MIRRRDSAPIARCVVFSSNGYSGSLYISTGVTYLGDILSAGEPPADLQHLSECGISKTQQTKKQIPAAKVAAHFDTRTRNL